MREVRGVRTSALALIILISICLCACGSRETLPEGQCVRSHGMVELPDGYVAEGKVQEWEDYTIVDLSDGTVIEGKTQSLSDYTNSVDFVCVEINGIKYYTHSSNVVLIHK